MVQVHIQNGPGFEAEDGDTLLRGALRAGIGFPHECNVGGCGACKYELLSGEVHTLWNEAPGLSERDKQRGRRLACQSVPKGALTIRTRLSPEYEACHRPLRMAAILVDTRPVTHDITEFSFRTDAPAEFLPGQYALLSLPGVEGVRAYSMSNLPNAQGTWQFMVRRVPGGRGTAVLFDEIQLGSQVILDGAYGLAWFRQPMQRDIVCVAGGSGLAPMLSIARAAAPMLKSAGRKLFFYYGARSKRDLLDDSLLACLPGFGTHLLLSQAMSQAAAETLPAPEHEVQIGYIHDLVDLRHGDSLAQQEIYFAGPPAMVDSVQTLLMQHRKVPYDQIHFDRFC